MTRQLSFDLPRKIARGRDDLFVSPANALAVAVIENPAAWPGGKLVLTGPAGSGKTHLAHVWAAASGARIIAARDLTDAMVPDLAHGPLAVEDVPAIAGDPTAEAALFHLHNLGLAEGHPLLLTGRPDPSRWGLTLPDLRSRIEAAQVATLSPPDDALLAAVLAKLFADRQVIPKPDLIPYLIDHMERSFEAAATMVDRLDHAALTEARTISRSLAVRMLAQSRDGAGDGGRDAT
jgi:chromosomal replication initiation ATPase DnaA